MNQNCTKMFSNYLPLAESLQLLAKVKKAPTLQCEHAHTCKCTCNK